MCHYNEILDQLEKGELRAAQKLEGNWKVNIEVKKAILEAFKEGHLTEFDNYIDKNTLPTQKFKVEDNVRIVPGGSSVRRGSYVSKNCIIMPPSYVNIGAFIDEGTMIDSHVLVGSCAQIGKRVHLSAGVQIGGVLEPIGLSPVIIEDDCFIGANAAILEGILVKTGAVIAPGVILSKGIRVYDCVNEITLEKGAAIPDNAVVVPGCRPIEKSWAKNQGLMISTPIIIKYKDSKTKGSLVLENLLR